MKTPPADYSFDPATKTEITRKLLDALVREIKQHLSKKRSVSVTLMKS